MYVDDNKTNLSTFSETDVFSDTVSGNDVECVGSVSSSLPSGSNGTTAGTFSGGDAVSSDVSAGDIGINGSQLVGESAIQTVSSDYTEILVSIDSGISTFNHVAFLIFIFLLMEWTEKKISVTVHRFTRERRR